MIRLERMNPTIGIPIMNPAIAFKTRPICSKKSRRRGITLRLWTHWRMTFRFVWGHYWFEVEGCVPVVASAVLADLPWSRSLAAGCEPGHDIGNFLGRHRFPWDVVPETRHPEFRPAGDHHRPQILVAHQAEIGRSRPPILLFLSRLPRRNRGSWHNPAQKSTSPRSASPKAALYGGRLSVGAS